MTEAAPSTLNIVTLFMSADWVVKSVMVMSIILRERRPLRS